MPLGTRWKQSPYVWSTEQSLSFGFSLRFLLCSRAYAPVPRCERNSFLLKENLLGTKKKKKNIDNCAFYRIFSKNCLRTKYFCTWKTVESNSIKIYISLQFNLQKIISTSLTRSKKNPITASQRTRATKWTAFFFHFQKRERASQKITERFIWDTVYSSIQYWIEI